MPGYLEDLTLRLARDVASLPEAVRLRHAVYLQRWQQADGGFSGREGPSDLYYTGFALRALAMLGELYGPTAENAARYLQSHLDDQESVINIASLIYSTALLDLAAGIDVLEGIKEEWRAKSLAALARLRRPDGGYAKAQQGDASSTYHTFLVVVCLQLLDQPIPDPERIVAYLDSQRTAEGGFREIRVAKRGGTNPTVAALATLRILSALSPAQRAATLGFLSSMQTAEGGLRANTRIPVADLLSTFTGLLTFADLAAFDAIDTSAARRYVEACERREGGFHGAAWDDGHDVEYTFYGLGSLALLYSLG